MKRCPICESFIDDTDYCCPLCKTKSNQYNSLLDGYGTQSMKLPPSTTDSNNLTDTLLVGAIIMVAFLLFSFLL